MKNLARNLLFLFAVICYPSRGYSQFIEGQSYICQQINKPITIDGTPNEQAWAQAKWTNEFVDIEGDKKPRPYLKTQVKMLWNENYLYFYAQLEEPHIWANLKQRDTVIFWDNDFEIFIDPNGDTQNYYELEINALNTVWDLMLTKPYRDGGKAITSWDIAGLQTAIFIDGTLNNPSNIDRYWGIEVAIPWHSLIETLPKTQRKIEGKTMRINYSRVQWETEIINNHYVKKKLPENNWVWSPQRVIAMHEPEFWGKVYFSSNPTETGQSILDNTNSEKVRQLLYSIHRAQRSRLKKIGSFSDKKEDILNSSRWGFETQLQWSLMADQYWYHVKLNDPFIKNLVWHIDESGKLWSEKTN